MFWLLEYMGHPKVSIMNGGLAGWNAWDLKLTKDETIIAHPRTKFDVSISPENFIAPPRKNRRLANANEKPDFFGLPRVWIACSKNVPAGMPVSDFKHIPWDQTLDSAGNLKNAGQLIEVYEGAGVLKY